MGFTIIMALNVGKHYSNEYVDTANKRPYTKEKKHRQESIQDKSKILICLCLKAQLKLPQASEFVNFKTQNHLKPNLQQNFENNNKNSFLNNKTNFIV